MHDIIFIRESPKFVISLLKSTLHIVQDTNPINNKTYEYKNSTAVYIKKELNIFPYITHNVVAFFLLSLLKKNEMVLVIEAQGTKDEISLKNCNMKKIGLFVEKMNRILPLEKKKYEI